jgi:cysteine-rich repeat protein
MPSPTSPAEYDGCGGYCGDGIVQEPYEQCDLGSTLNGAWNSGCSKNCTCTPVCGNGVKECVSYTPCGVYADISIEQVRRVT